jgi:glucokinase
MVYAVGIDIGGTKTAIALVNEKGETIEKDVIPTDTKVTPEDMIGLMKDKVDDILTRSKMTVEDIEGIGIGVPGPIDLNKGELAYAPNLPNWKNTPIVPLFLERFPTRVVLANDANAAALGEKWLGAGKDSNHFIYITISTGIGGGIFSDGKLFTGFKGNAAEVGHMVIEYDGPVCGCGQKGCFEAVASGTAIARDGSAIYGKKLTTKEVFDLYKSGDTKMVPYVEGVFNKIGTGITSLINLLEPEMVVLGGGVTNVGEPLFTAVTDYVKKHAISRSGKQTRIVPSELSQDTGVMGAAALILV